MKLCLIPRVLKNCRITEKEKKNPSEEKNTKNPGIQWERVKSKTNVREGMGKMTF